MKSEAATPEEDLAIEIVKDDLSIKDVKDNLFEKGHGQSSARKEDGAFSASDLLEKLK